MNVIEEKLKLLPDKAGVYVMLDADGQIIYVGKAKNLKNRVRQYFFNSVKTEKVMAMVSRIADFYYIIAPSEIDALSLENNLIKKHKPRYNILLKDDKTYPYIKVNLKDRFPNFSITRKVKKDGAKYFGPFMGGISATDVLDTVNFAYKLRLCDKNFIEGKEYKPCLNYHISNCFAPCANFISEKDYKELVNKAVDFLNGDIEETKALLEYKMKEASDMENFEFALRCREKLQSLDKIAIKRLTALNKFLDADIIAYKSNDIYSVVNILFVRKGRMLGGKNFSFESMALSDGDAIREFILQYYKKDIEIPAEIITSVETTDDKLTERYFQTQFDKKVSIITAQMGIRKQLLDMAEVNAEEHLQVAVGKIKHKNDMTTSACQRLKEILNLQNYPKRMECYDISNSSGTDKGGSRGVFNDGEPDRTSYRRFKIKTFEGADDFRSLQEMLSRRFMRLENDAEKFPKPDLIVIDGGKGQLSSVKEIFDKMNITGIDLISLAEREEEIFTLFSKQSVRLEKRDYCLKMLQRIRDEAHRFAITYHRSLRDKRALSSVLDRVRGLGKIKRQRLLEKFKDIGGIISASQEDLLTVEGIGQKQAEAILETLKEEGLL